MTHGARGTTLCSFRGSDGTQSTACSDGAGGPRQAIHRWSSRLVPCARPGVQAALSPRRSSSVSHLSSATRRGRALQARWTPVQFPRDAQVMLYALSFRGDSD
jgi:hypothetical protein